MRRMCGDVHALVRQDTLPQPHLPVHPELGAHTSRGMCCTCICPGNLYAEHKGLSSMWNARKGRPSPPQPFPTSPWLSEPLHPPNGGCMSRPPACPLLPLFQVPFPGLTFCMTALGGSPGAWYWLACLFPAAWTAPELSGAVI